jgi:hypothetical protein
MATATNPETGERVYLDEATNSWMPAQTATNPQTGEKLIYDGKSWTSLPQTNPVYASPQADQTLRDTSARTTIPPSIQGVGAGAAEFAGMLPDTAAAVANVPLAGYDLSAKFLGQPETGFRFPRFSDAIKTGADELLQATTPLQTQNPDDMRWQDKLAYNANRFGVQAAGLIPALTRAGAVRTAAVQGGDPTHRWFDPLVKPYAGEQSGRAITADALAAAGSSAGVTAVDSSPYTKGNALADFAGVMAGGGAGTSLAAMMFAAPQMLGRAVRGLTGFGKDTQIPLNPDVPFAQQQTFPKTVVDKATDIFQGEAVQPQQAQQRMVQSQSEIAPYMTDLPTTGALSEDTGLMRLEKELKARNQVAYDEKTRALNTAARNTVEGVVPPGADRQDLINTVQNEANAQRAAALEGVTRAERGVQRVENVRQGQAQDYTPAANPPAPASTALHREIVDQSLDPMTAEKNTRYGAVPPVGVSPAPLVQVADDIINTAARLPDPVRNRVLPREFLDSIESWVTRDPETGNIIGIRDTDFQTLNEIRPLISAEITNARRAGAPPALLDNLEALKNGINNITQNLPQAAQANQYMRDVFSPVWGNQNPTANQFRRQFWQESRDESKVPPSQTASKFIQSNAPEKTAELQRIIGSMPNPAQAQTAARDFLMSDLAASGAVNRQGVLDPRAVERWATANRTNLDLVPGFRRDIEGVLGRARKGVEVSERMTGDLVGAQQAAKQTDQQIQKSALGAVLKAQDPDKVVHSIMGDPLSSGTKLDELITLTANNPRARAGLKQSVQDFILDKATGTASEKMKPGDQRGPVSYAKLTQIFDEHSTQLAKIYEPDEMNALRAVHRSLGLAKGGMQAGAGSTEAVTRLHRNIVEEFRGTPVGRAVEATARLKFGALTAGGKFAGIRRALHGVGSEEAKQIEALLVRASLEPDVAKVLLGRDLKVGSPAWNKSLSRILGAGEAARDISESE